MSHDQREDGAGPIVAALHRTVADVQPPVERLTETARARGRAVRRRRNTLAVVAGGVVLALGAVGSARLATRTAEQPPPVATPEEPRTHEWWRQSAAEMARQLEKLLPDNVRIDSTGVRASDPRTGLLRARITNAMAGTGGMTVTLVPTSPGERLSCPEGLVPPDTCVVTEGAAGVTQILERHRVDGELVVISVATALEDGGLVRVAAANTLAEVWNGSAEVWGPEPPVSMGELLAIAESPTWQESGPLTED